MTRPTKAKHLLLFIGDDVVDLGKYSAALNDEYILKFCGCATTIRAFIKEAENRVKGHELDLIIVIWKQIAADTAKDIARAARERFKDIPIMVIAHPTVSDDAIDLIDPEWVIREAPGDDHLRLLPGAVKNVLGQHYHDRHLKQEVAELAEA